MEKEKLVSLIIPSRNTLQYLKWAYNSFRKNNGYKHEIVLLDDASTDGTWEWMIKIHNEDNNTKLYRNELKERVGHTILYDKGIEIASNEICIIGHSDMYYTPLFIDNLLKHHNKKTVVCATRIEPPLHPEGVEKITIDFGLDILDFKESRLLDFVRKKIVKNNNKITNGIFAPWLISKSDFYESGGHDRLFAPQSREDSDLFNRFFLLGFNLIQSWDSFVYHLTCRGSRFKEGLGKNSVEWQQTNYKGERNFIRKWGSPVLHDKYMLPIISNKYDIQLIIDMIDAISPIDFFETLRIIEPFVSQVIIFDNKNIYSEEVMRYIYTEQELTLYNMNKRVLYNPNEKIKEKDICIFATPYMLSSDGFVFIQILPKILDSIKEEGIYEYDKIKIKINRLKKDYYLENLSI